MPPSTPQALAVAAGLAIAAMGCGRDEQAPAPGFDRQHARDVDRDPYLLTCGDLALQSTGQDAARLVIRAEFALAQVPELRERVEELTLNRTGRSVYYALTEVCKGRGEAFRPAKLAVEGVREGRYVAARNRPG